MDKPVNLDDPESWPPELRQLATLGARHPGCQTRFTSDLRPPEELSRAIELILAEHGVVVYHCTRLMESEVDDIRVNGLRATSQELLADKVAAALQAGLLTDAQVERILTTGVLSAVDQRAARTNEICTVANLHTIEAVGDGLEPYLQNWGGEITYFWQQTREDLELEKTLREIGRPTLIALHHRPSEHHRYFPELAKIVIGRWREHEDYGGEVHLRVPENARVPVLNLWQPGDEGLPREASDAIALMSGAASLDLPDELAAEIAAQASTWNVIASGEGEVRKMR
ncbi:hypothetical protein ACFQZZ_01290 [Nocardia sp. GCM10030253]|uniref:hypothetical protein n=1 Tax=Nocardia sp. GCM10030253 TaxID=3273404 RepID=UPI00363520F6